MTATFNPARAAAAIEKSLRAAGTPERAEGSKRYLKSDLTFVGATVPAIRTIVKAFTKQYWDLTREEVRALAAELWAKPVFERRAVAVMMLEHYNALLGVRDLPFVLRMIRESKTWALVDALAPNVAGAIALGDARAYATFDRWAKDSDFWVRRASMLALLPSLKLGREFDRFGGYADAMLEEKEFFIRKAIGWVLRDTSKRHPDQVFEWLKPRIGRLSGVTKHEAVRWLGPERNAVLGTDRKLRH